MSLIGKKVKVWFRDESGVERDLTATGTVILHEQEDGNKVLAIDLDAPSSLEERGIYTALNDFDKIEMLEDE